MGMETNDVVTVLCPKLVINRNDPALQWLIGSPFLPPLTIVSTVRCIHSSNGSSSPDLLKESEDIRVLLPKGFEVIGALKTCVSSESAAAAAGEAIGAVCELRKLLADGGGPESCAMVGGVSESGDGEVRFFVLRNGSSGGVEPVGSAGWDDRLGKSVWERGCLLRCEVPVKLPVYVPVNDPSGVEKMFLRATEAVAAKFKDPQAMYLLERSNEVSSELSPPIIIRGQELDFSTDLKNIKLVDEETLVPGEGGLTCKHFCLQSKSAPGTRSAENADVLQVSVLLNTSRQSAKSEAPVAEYFPVEEARLAIAFIDLEVLCYADKGLPLKYAISKLIIPALVDQLNSMKGTILSNLLTKQPQLHAYHFNPPGWLHPVTAIYELDYGETEQKQGRKEPIAIKKKMGYNDATNTSDSFNILVKVDTREVQIDGVVICAMVQSMLGLVVGNTLMSCAECDVDKEHVGLQIAHKVEIRRSLHLRLGLPSDRPLLRIANAMEFSVPKDNSGSNTRRKGALLRDVHHGIPSSGVSGGVVSLVQGSYEYHHYLQDGFDDSGWGCAYRSLQTIISWFRLQYYTSIDVPSHRDIQQALVEIGDKDPSFIGSREWIGAIELSFVLDKLLGATCKIINVRSGAELPEKCRELALHFETQGTPIMIGGGVLAYTLLGVDYNEASGDCAFLILDPHYTGTDEHKKIVNGGWCGWKKAVDSKGKNFFLHDKFYNLLLPQRPNMV